MMKSLLIKVFGFLNKRWLNITCYKGDSYTGFFFKVKAVSNPKSLINIENSSLKKVIISVSGEENSLSVNKCCINDSTIVITGKGNRLILENGVRLSNANIIIRGTENVVRIGRASTFGGIRIINVGSQNSVSIGAECLFSDNIELWSSDTHSIFNESGELINPERPVKIGNKVWVGSRVIILKGVTIGNGSIIGMGSVVTKDIPDGVVSAGYPNRTIKENVTWKLDYSTNKTRN